MSIPAFSKIQNRIQSYRDEIIRLQTELTAIPAMGPENGGQGEVDKAEYIKTLLMDLNPDKLEQIDAPDKRVERGIRPNLIARFRGRSADKTVWIMAHMDVVSPGDPAMWESDPFTVINRDGKLIGRGTEDNQQAIVSAILAVRALQEENVRPAHDIGLAIVADEEAGSVYGIQHVLGERPDLFRKDDLILIPDAGDPDGEMIEVAEKSILWIRISVRGKQTHGSTPGKGINAHKAGAFLITRMNELYTLFPDRDEIYDVPESTFEPTRKEANVPNINTIPGEDIFYFDCRVLPRYSLDNIKKQIRVWADGIEKEFGVTIAIEYPQDHPAPPPTPADAPVCLALQSAMKELFNQTAKPMGIGGGTVAAYFRRAGLPAVCWSHIADVCHEPNEYCLIDNVLKDIQVFAHIFLQKQ